MKKILPIIFCLIIILSVVFSMAPTVMAATPTYYYVKEATSMIIDDSNKNLSGTINIPATWYVKVTERNEVIENGITYRVVEYNGIVGKIDKSKLSTKSTALSTAQIYFNKDITNVQSTLESPIAVRSDAEAATNVIKHYINVGSNIKFLASTNHKTYLISWIENSTTNYGFVKKLELKDVPEILATENPNSKNPDDATTGNGTDLNPGTDGNQDKSPTNNLLRILLIVTICVLAVFVVFLIFKPSKKKPRDEFYDDYSKPSR